MEVNPTEHPGTKARSHVAWRMIFKLMEWSLKD